MDAAEKESTTLAPDLVAGHLDQVDVRRRALVERIANTTDVVIPAFNTRRMQEMLLKLEAKTREARETLVPKKKFTFKNKSGGVKPMEVDVSTTESVAAAVVGAVGAAERQVDSGVVLYKRAGEIDGGDFSANHMVDSTIHVLDHCAAVLLADLARCRVYCGPTARSILVRDCQECQFWLASRQVCRAMMSMHRNMPFRFEYMTAPSAISAFMWTVSLPSLREVRSFELGDTTWCMTELNNTSR